MLIARFAGGINFEVCYQIFDRYLNLNIELEATNTKVYYRNYILPQLGVSGPQQTVKSLCCS